MILAIAQLVGIAQAASINVIGPLIIIEAVFTAFLIFRFRLRKHVLLLISAFGILLAGSAGYVTAKVGVAVKYAELIGHPTLFTGYIDSDVKYDAGDASYTFYMQVDADKARDIKAGRIRVKIEDVMPDLNYRWGKAVNLKCVPGQAAGARNPGEFDWAGYLSNNKISATVQTGSDSVEFINENRTGIIKQSAIYIRKAAADVLAKYMPDRSGAVLNAMLTGDASGIDSETQKYFSDTGLVHILTVSGMHMAFLIALMSSLLHKLHASKTLTAILIIPALLYFSLITGFSTPVLRAFIGSSIMMAAVILKREFDPLTGLACASLILLLLNPMTALTLSFQLTFASMLCIYLFGKQTAAKLKSMHIPDMIGKPLSVTLATQAGILPLTAMYFYRMPVLSVPANLLTAFVTEPIFTMGLVMIPLSGIFPIAANMIGAAEKFLVGYMIHMTQALASLKYSTWLTGYPGLLNLILAFSVGALLINHKVIFNKHKRAAVAAAMTLIVFFAVVNSPGFRPGVRITFLDVGQGDCAVIQTRYGKNIVVDCGGQSPETAQRTLMSYLAYRGISRIDLMILTHAHADHAGAAESIAAEKKVVQLAVSGYDSGDEMLRLTDAFARSGTNIIKTGAGDTIDIAGDLSLEFLLPDAASNNSVKSDNDESLVFILKYRELKVLFAADMENSGEAFLNSEDIGADVLKVGHHGSNTSSGADFLDKVRPRAAIVSVGRNTFGHPSEYVLERLTSRGAVVYRTDRQGGIVVESDGSSINIKETIRREMW